MKRREFITLLGGAAAWPLAARAQQAGRVYRIGVLETSPAASNAANFDALRKALRELGYVEGQNLVLDQAPGSRSFHSHGLPLVGARPTLTAIRSSTRRV
jgi:hypothetical protein